MDESEGIEGNNPQLVENNNEPATPSSEGNQGTTNNQGNNGTQNTEAAWKPGDPFHKHPDWIKREEKLRALETQVNDLSKAKTESAASSQNTANGTPTASGNNTTTTGEVDTSSLDGFYNSFESQLPPVSLPEMEVDKDGNITKVAFNSYADMYKAFEKQLYIRNAKRSELEQTYWQQQKEASDKAFEGTVGDIKKDIADDESFKEFIDFASKTYEDKEINTPIGELYKLWKSNIYKPKDPLKKNRDAAGRVSQGGAVQEPKNNGTQRRSVSSTNWEDL